MICIYNIKIYFLAVIFLFGCTSKIKVDNYDVNIPDHWESPIPSTDLYTGNWWSEFNDSTLVQFINKVNLENNSLNSIILQRKIALQNAHILGAMVYPNFNIGINGNNSQQNLTNFSFAESFLESNDQSDNNTTNVTSFNVESYGLQLGFQWELDLWGRALNARKAAFSDFKALEYELSYLKFSILVRSVQAYFQAIEAIGQLKISRESYNNLLEIRDLVKDRYLKGVRSSLDYRMAETALASATVEIEYSKLKSNQMNRMINLLQGDYPNSNFDFLSELPQKIPPIPSGIPADIIKRRPDIKALILKIESENFRLSQNKRNLFPSLVLTSSIGTSTNELKNLLNGDYGIWNMGISLTEPLFNQGKIRRSIKAQKAIKENALYNFNIKLLDSFSEIEELLELENSYNIQLEALLIAETQSKDAFKLARERYDKGLATLELVLNSQKTYNDIRSQNLSLKKEKLNNRLSLILALGGSMDIESEKIEIGNK